MRILGRVGSALGTAGDFIMNHSGKLFLLIIAVSLLGYVGYQVRKAPTKEGLTTKQEALVTSLGNDYLDNAAVANNEKDYQTAYDQASLYLKSATTTVNGRVEAYLARGEAQIHLLNCKDAMADLYMAASVSPNDKTLQSRIAEKLDVIFYGKDCDGKY